jgi:bis(5'-nucleosyl)-tetraphosphatase (symmetrical)
MHLLEKLNFNPKQDTLWFVGDLVNRGPDSLNTLRFIKDLKNKAICVLGNHDLHLLALHFGVSNLTSEDTVGDILSAPDREELINWLQQQPLVHYDPILNYTMVHAGFAPMWSLEQALTLANEVSTALKSTEASEYLRHMYGNAPNLWNDQLQGFIRIRVITNYLTRIRFCDQAGHLDLKTKDLNCPANFYPWFLVPGRKTATQNIIFGHWASLQGRSTHPHAFALDTGAVWGKELTAMCLETKAKFSVKN